MFKQKRVLRSTQYIRNNESVHRVDRLIVVEFAQ